MQPYLFPYIEYFRMMAGCDIWIAFDTAQFSRGGWANRNRILDRNKGWSWLTIPVRRDGLETSIADCRIDNSKNWKAQIKEKLRVYEVEAPNYKYVISLLDNINDNQVYLGDLNFEIINSIKSIFNIDTELIRLSDLDFEPPVLHAGGGWPLFLCNKLGAKTYINAAGGQFLYDSSIFEKSGVQLVFHKHIDVEYETGSFKFISDLSILDMMMWVDFDVISSKIRRKK
nr:WbqC family protein [Halovulum dunhuangense]